jgi:hypothetical protein
MKRRKPPRLPDSFFGWILPLMRISKTEMLDKVGLDAVIVSWWIKQADVM